MTTVTQSVPHSEWKSYWHLALGSMVANGTGVALYTYVSSLFIPSLQAEFGWSRGDISSASSIGYAGVLTAPLIGKLVDKAGARHLALFFACITALIYVGYACMNGELLWITFLTAGSLIAAPANSAPIFSKALNTWFIKSRGLALGLSASGVPIMAIGVSMVLQQVISEHGWRSGYLMLCAMAIAICLPSIFLTVRENPNYRVLETTYGKLSHLSSESTLAQAIKKRKFWLLTGAVFLCTAPAQGFLSQLTPLVIDRGYTVADAAIFLSIYSAAVIIGRLTTGYLLDRHSPYIIALVVTVIPAAGLLMLMGEGTQGRLTTALAIAIVGIQNGGESDIVPFFIAREFGMNSFSTLSGVAFTAAFIASALGILMLGKIFDATGNYDLALAIFITSFIVAGIFYYLIGLGNRTADATVSK